MVEHVRLNDVQRHELEPGDLIEAIIDRPQTGEGCVYACIFLGWSYTSDGDAYVIADSMFGKLLSFDRVLVRGRMRDAHG